MKLKKSKTYEALSLEEKEKLDNKIEQILDKGRQALEKRGIDIDTFPGDLSSNLDKKPGEIPLCLGIPD